MKEALVQCSDLEVMLEDMQLQLKDAKAKHEMLSTLVARVISLQHHGVNEKGDDQAEEDPSDDEYEASDAEQESKKEKQMQEHYDEEGDDTGSSSGISIPQGDGSDIRNKEVTKPV